MKKYLIPTSFLFAILIAGCGTLGNVDSIHREFSLSDHKSELIDAKQRMVLIAADHQPEPAAGDIRGNLDVYTPHSPTGTIVCAEPSPDALAMYSASLAAKGSYSGASGEIDAASQEQAISLAQRTASIQLMRDSYYRLCEAYMSGEISRWNYDAMFRRMATDTIAYLAIEQLTNAAGQAQKAIAADAPKTVTGHATPAAGAADDNATHPAQKPKSTQLTQPKNLRYAHNKRSPKLAPNFLIPANYVASEETGLGGDDDQAASPQSSGAKPILIKETKADDTGTRQPNPDASDSDSIKQPTPNAIQQVSTDVKAIVTDIIDADYAPTMCLSYSGDHDGTVHGNMRPEAQNEQMVALCGDVLRDEGAKFRADNAKQSALEGAASAFLEKCIKNDGYTTKRDYCDNLKSFFAPSEKSGATAKAAVKPTSRSTSSEPSESSSPSSSTFDQSTTQSNTKGL